MSGTRTTPLPIPRLDYDQQEEALTRRILELAIDQIENDIVLAKSQTTVSSLVICNRSGSAITFRVSVHVANASADDKQFLFFDESLAATTTRTVVIGMCLSQSDVLKVYVSAANVSFNLFGVETT